MKGRVVGCVDVVAVVEFSVAFELNVVVDFNFVVVDFNFVVVDFKFLLLLLSYLNKFFVHRCNNVPWSHVVAGGQQPSAIKAVGKKMA